MDNNLSKLQAYIRQNPVLVSIFVLLQIIFVILLIFVIKNLNTSTFEESNLPVSNLKQDLQDLPENSVETIQTALYDAVATNQGTLNSIEDSDARVREGTLVNLYFEKQNMHYVNVIIDIPSIQQSYQIFNEWSDNPTNQFYMLNMATMAMCLSKDQIIYQDFNCKDKYNQKGQNIVTAEFLKYFTFNQFTPILRNSDLSTVYINPVSFDINDNTKQSYIQETKDAISSLGISPDIFKYKVQSLDDLDYTIPQEYR
ncbi:MAG: hypothetical protein K6G49_00865 [Candidatus Saccharibacteria bacterium]|nr:hypothetical protein [Candidatus Saccharibacteria bacterium]